MAKFYDPVHQFIHLDEDEALFIDTTPIQRLRFIRQMGGAFLVYPGATHSRFEHSLGVMEVATQIYDRVIPKLIPKDKNYDYWRKVVRLAALFHDSGHLPFSHVAESTLLGPGGHERWTYQIIQSAELKPLWNQLGQKYGYPEMADHVCKVAIGEKKLREIGHSPDFSFFEKIVSELITGDFFGADRIDYLIRDSRCTGVSYGLFDHHHLIESIEVLPIKKEGREELELGIVENGLEACEALLLARHFMHRRVYHAPSAQSVNFHLACFMKSICTISDLKAYLSQNDAHIMKELFTAASDPQHPGHLDAKSVLEKSHRLRAIPIHGTIPVENLIDFQKKNELSSTSIKWELAAESPSNLGLTFPVLTRNQKIVPGSSISTLSIPGGSSSWVYVEPSFEERFIQTLTP